MLTDLVNNYFGFNKQQRNGLFVLLLISFILLVIRISYPFFMRPSPIVVANLPLVELKVDSIYENNNHYTKKYADKENWGGVNFVFDPNTVSYESLLKLGFRKKTASGLIKFRSKGFIFRKKEDLKKVYGVSDKFYLRLEPYIMIENKAENKIVDRPSTSVKHELAPQKQTSQQKVLELNTADSISLVGLNGIGPGYAKRIIKYRSMLGGFNSVEQLKEVYGFTEELFEKVRSSFTVDAKLVRKIDLNKDDFKVINKHPYLSYELTKTIFDWRRKTNINATNLKQMIGDDLIYAKLLPYLALNPEAKR